MQVKIREVRKTDMHLIKKYTADTGWKGIPQRQRKRLDEGKWRKHMIEVFEGFLKRESSRIFVAEDENRTFLGYVFVGEFSDLIMGLTFGFVYDIFVGESFRGKGIGKILLQKAVDYCQRNGYTRILLMVAANNRIAKKLYSKTGFKPEQVYMAKDIENGGVKT